MPYSDRSLDNEELRQDLSKLIDPLRKEMIVEQLSVLAEESKLELAERHKSIRKRVRALVKQSPGAGNGELRASPEDTVISPAKLPHVA